MRFGYDIFGKEYGIMLRNDLHHINSIDHKFLKEMCLLDDESHKFLYGNVFHNDLRDHELYNFSQQFKGTNDFNTVINVLKFTSDIALNYNIDFNEMLFGGTEKEILERGTDWCADMSRLGAVILQSLGIPCRILHIADKNRAYYAHVVNEAYYDGKYGVIDFIFGYQFYDNKPISAKDILNDSSLLKDFPEDYTAMYSLIAISEYDPMDVNNNYLISKPNEYTLNIMNTNHNGKWIMGEDKI
ncbi:MAG: hypothetical protein Q4A75_08820 [Peptostreptococcaceae bacterium]|nr:hypothetical protein [Peptostreptococcaceae bacterium]